MSPVPLALLNPFKDLRSVQRLFRNTHLAPGRIKELKSDK
jgi:hypothetical protein